jgi:hypothetical protein
MDQQRPERPEEVDSAEARAGWTTPQVDRLVAGGAEASSGADVEGLDGLS